MPYGLLLAKKHDAHPCELADLHGRRLAVSVEVDDGRRLAESLVKTLTGSDTIAARRMRENFWQFAPSHKIWLAANHRPRVHGTDLAMWRRMRLIPFAVTIPAEQQDKRLPEKLRAEGPGILAWLVRGCLDWQRHGLGEPEAVKAATAEYRNEQDVIGSFLAEMTFEASTGRLKASKLHAAYVAWCKRTGEHAVNQTRFGRALTERGLEKVTSNGVWYHGIGISEGLEGSEAFWVLAPTRACRELIGEIT
jgi:putative DNA primase/helicase